MNPPYVRTFQGGILGTVGGTAIAPGVPNSAVDATVAANQDSAQDLRTGAALLCLSTRQRRRPAFRPLPLRPCPAANFTRRTSWNGVSGLSISSERPPASSTIRRHASRQPTLSDAGEWLPNGMPGMLRSIPIHAANRPAICCSDAVLDRRKQPLQRASTDGDEAAGARLQGQINYTWSRCMDEVSNGGFLAIFRGRHSLAFAGRTSSRLWPLRLRHSHNLNAQYVYQLPVKVHSQSAGAHCERLAGLGHTVLAQRRSIFGLEHTVLCRRERHRAGKRSSVCQPCTRSRSLLPPLHTWRPRSPARSSG